MQLSVLVISCFSIVVVLLLVVQGGAVCLPTPPSWPELNIHFLLMSSFIIYKVVMKIVPACCPEHISSSINTYLLLLLLLSLFHTLVSVWL